MKKKHHAEARSRKIRKQERNLELREREFASICRKYRIEDPGTRSHPEKRIDKDEQDETAGCRKEKQEAFSRKKKNFYLQE
ncbi:hypothetical protein D5R95_04005 [Methanosalsum natronophilum]|uniref:Uncharacterized protein n=1 Tax=Methanosalsum natronophilum TaxID=768733 RepID=A0A3R7WEU0_9EURY|nr:MAG: hypothetical protein D5R95_04005 [Methanosalsum natronophilum]